MAQAQSYESSPTTPTDRNDAAAQAPATDAFTDTNAAMSTKSGPGNWGVAARWVMFALLAIAFVVTLTVLL